jgi:CDP-glucose 4,6-dehydratase
MLLGKLGMINKEFWNGKKVFVTGHTGFKGSWLCLWLLELGAEVTGYSLAPITDPSLFEATRLSEKMHSIVGDIRDFAKLKAAVINCGPEIIIHMAAQPLVRKSYRDPIETYSTNVMGTVNILEAARFSTGLKIVLNITTDKVYENKELDVPFKEEDRLGGFDPYSNSKACSELITSSYRSSFFENTDIRILTARAGNVIGGGDWSEDRLVPDIIRSVAKKTAVIIRSPQAVRPWQHVLESISGYLSVVEYSSDKSSDQIDSLNFGPGTSDFMTVGQIISFIQTEIPGLDLKVEFQTSDLHEAQILKLDNSLALKKLSWKSRWKAKDAILKTFSWYEQFMNGQDAYEITLDQIREFQIR